MLTVINFALFFLLIFGAWKIKQAINLAEQRIKEIDELILVGERSLVDLESAINKKKALNDRVN